MASNTPNQAATPPQQQQLQAAYQGGNPAAYGYQPTAADILVDLALRTLFDFIQRAMAAPVDRLMVLTATEGELKRQGRLSKVSGFGGIWGCIKRIWTKEGFSGFFRGLGADFVLSLPSGLVDAFSTNFVFFLLQRGLPEQFANNMTYFQVLVISMLATTASVAVATPYNALRKTIMTNYMADIVAPAGGAPAERAEEENSADGTKASNKKTEAPLPPGSPLSEGYRYATATETAASIGRRQGWRAFYRGAVLDPVVICAYRGIYVATTIFVSQDLQMMYPGAVARGMAVVADLITQPLEVVSRRAILTASDDQNPPYDGVVDCARTIVKEEGVTALWSGLKFRLLTSAVTACIGMLFASGGGEGAQQM